MSKTHDEDAAEQPTRAEDQSATHWKGDGWAARIVRNEDDEGWAVEMTRDGELEPALLGPWTMGRDKKNPKPLDAQAFAVLVRGANDVRTRQQQQLKAQLHRSVVTTTANGERVRVDLDIVPDDDDPHAILTAFDETGAIATRSTVAANFVLNEASARKWLVENGADA
jgi:hypothetical protein